MHPSSLALKPFQQDSIRYTAGDKATRPWGEWEVLSVAENYIVKRITVQPGRRLSLQYHEHRNEHWVVIEGEGEIEIGQNIFYAVANSHFLVPATYLHRISNVGTVPLIIIETQYGPFLDESDIVRVQDDYGR